MGSLPLFVNRLDPKIPRRSWRRSGRPRKSSLTLVLIVICHSQVVLVLTTCSIAEPLTEEETARKEAYIEDGFPDWSRRDFQQFVKALEAYGW